MDPVGGRRAGGPRLLAPRRAPSSRRGNRSRETALLTPPARRGVRAEVAFPARSVTARRPAAAAATTEAAAGPVRPARGGTICARPGRWQSRREATRRRARPAAGPPRASVRAFAGASEGAGARRWRTACGTVTLAERSLCFDDRCRERSRPMIDLRRITLGAAAPVLAAACAVASRPGGGAVPGGGAIPAGSAASISASSPAGDAGEGAAGPICSDIAGCISIAERAYLAMDAAPPDAPERLEHGDRGARALRAACALGDPDGCYRLADAYALGRGVPPSAGCQIRFLRRACDLGSADGCVTLADVYQWNGGGIAAAPRLAVSLYETACAAGRMDACGKLAAMVQEGAGVPRDEARAAHLYEQVCEHGTASGNPTEIRACAPLARMLLEGRLVPKDEARAVSYLEAACEMGEFPACGEAALLYAFGRGVPREPTRAGALFDTACANGFGAWCKEAEALYRTGRGLPRDSARADHFLESSLAWLAYGCRAHGVMGDCEAVVKAYSTGTGREPSRASRMRVPSASPRAADSRRRSTRRASGSRRTRRAPGVSATGPKRSPTKPASGRCWSRVAPRGGPWTAISWATRCGAESPSGGSTGTSLADGSSFVPPAPRVRRTAWSAASRVR
jgi:TPR repeat protein